MVKFISILVVVEVCGGERHFENIVLLKLGYEF